MSAAPRTASCIPVTVCGQVVRGGHANWGAKCGRSDAFAPQLVVFGGRPEPLRTARNLTQPIDVFRDLARVPRPGGRFVCTFSNRVFVTKAIRGWLAGTDDDRCAIVAEYFRASRVFGPATISRRSPVGHLGDPLFAVWATRA